MGTHAVELSKMPFHQVAMLFVYFVLAGITWVYGPIGMGVLGRISFADVLMAIIVGYCFLYILNRGKIYWSSMFTSAMVLFTMLLLAVFYSQRPMDGFIEWLVHVFLLVGTIGIYQLLVPLPMDERLRIIKIWMFASAVLGMGIIYDGVSNLFGLPIMSSYHIPGAAVGTFRNTGQAGTYMGTALALGLPLLSVCKRRDRPWVALTVLICILALALTVKRAAMIGFVLGILLVFLANLHRAEVKRYMALLLLALAVAQWTASFLSANSAHYQYRVERKWGTLSEGQLENDWLERHYSAVFELIMDRPGLGAGTAGVFHVYADKEVHSTYLNVLATIGIPGFVVYCFFLASMVYAIALPRHGDERARRFRAILIPMLIGLMVSWIYTYHLRKREFWIMVTLAAAVMAPLPRGSIARPKGAAAMAPFEQTSVFIETVDWRTKPS